MKRLLIVVLCTSGFPVAATLASENADRIAGSRAVIKEVMPRMKETLETTMKAEGPARAINVCREKSPRLLGKKSAETGWHIARTSLKYRNGKNRPDAWEEKVLRSFEERKAKGEPVDKLEHSEVVAVNGKKSFRYMKAIGTGAPCLSCHAGTIAPDVEAAISAHYPNDRARGFKAGDIRGAFTITQPM